MINLILNLNSTRRASKDRSLDERTIVKRQRRVIRVMHPVKPKPPKVIRAMGKLE